MDGIIAGFDSGTSPRFISRWRSARVIRPGGHIAVLDFFQPVGFVSKALSGYNRMVSRLWGAHHRLQGLYRYLHESMGAFCTAAEFVALMDEAGFDAELIVFPPVAPGLREQA